ncbi:MAG: stage III sporulation protein SpoIIIAB [Clostridium sp.]
MIELLGGIIIISSTTLLGFYYAKGLSERVQLIREIQYSLAMLESEIIYSSSPLIEAMQYVAQRSRSPVKEFFFSFSEKLYKKEIDCILDGFMMTVGEFGGKLKLEKDEIDSVGSFLKSLESSDMEGQKTSFNITMKKLESFEKRSEEIVKKNEKLYKYLGVCSGLLVVIILI